MSDLDSPDQISAAVLRQRELTDLPQALMGGTPAMRKAAEKYLPREPKESDAAYRARLSRSVLTNIFAQTVSSLVGRVFSKPISFGDDMPKRYTALAENIDGHGNSLNVFARHFLASALANGLAHVYVHFPRLPKGATQADAREIGARPMFRLVQHDSVLGFRTETINGVETLTQLRLLEEIDQPSGEFGENTVQHIRVIERGGWRVFEKQDKSWAEIEQGEFSTPGINLVTLYAGNKTGCLECEPFLSDLAYLNLAHWQSNSDQRNILRFARVPLMLASGFAEEDLDDQFEIGPSRLIVSSSADAKIEFVEHSGRAIEAGRQDLLDLEERMASFGVSMLTKRPGNQTATGRAIDSAESTSVLATVAQALEDALEQAFVLASKFMFPAEPSGSLTVFKEFSISDRATAEIDQLVKLRTSGNISRETLLAEFKRRGVLADDFNPAADADLLATTETTDLPGIRQAAE